MPRLTPTSPSAAGPRDGRSALRKRLSIECPFVGRIVLAAVDQAAAAAFGHQVDFLGRTVQGALGGGGVHRSLCSDGRRQRRCLAVVFLPTSDLARCDLFETRKSLLFEAPAVERHDGPPRSCNSTPQWPSCERLVRC